MRAVRGALVARDIGSTITHHMAAAVARDRLGKYSSDLQDRFPIKPLKPPRIFPSQDNIGSRLNPSLAGSNVRFNFSFNGAWSSFFSIIRRIR